ncbi:MAG: hypothetical protein A2V65_00010 [Deltaproteobacteria bacterium RBG_13_49_15]|nr:MAG: hypothetical protein A2V65_00010 [Deltaproteobacteria bacterium RBG_13_49_15]
MKNNHLFGPLTFMWICFSVFFFFAPAFVGENDLNAFSDPAYAEEAGKKATIEDAKQEAKEEAAKADEHAKDLKQGVKEDTVKAGKTVKSGAKGVFHILKDGIKSLLRGEGVKADKTAREEQNPQDE